MKKFRPEKFTSITGILFLIPAFIFISFSTFIPTIWNVIISFQKWDGFLSHKWVGFDNYFAAIMDETVRKCLFNSAYLALASTAIAVVAGVILAILIYKLGKREGAIYRLIIFMPVMLPLAIIGLLFAFILNPEMGLVNNFLKLIGAGSLAKAWLEDPSTAMWCLILVGAWRMIGLTMMLSFAAIQQLPSELFESCRIDGASYFRQVRSMVLPLIAPIIKLSTVFTLVLTFKTYDLVFVMTEGGPAELTKTIPLHMITTAFTFNEYGFSAAMGFLLTLLVMFIIILINKSFGGQEYEY